MKELILTDEQTNELQRLLRFYHAEAQRCRDARAYLAGCVAAGAALETGLILMVSLYPEEAVATGKYPTTRKKIRPLLDWRFDALLAVAKKANWLPSGLDRETDDWDGRRAKVGDYAEVVREIRNLAHPARYLQDHTNKRVTRRHLESVLNSVEAAESWLLARIEQSLLEAMKAEGWVQKVSRRSTRAPSDRTPKKKPRRGKPT
jgi:hypothetical protein